MRVDSPVEFRAACLRVAERLISLGPEMLAVTVSLLCWWAQ
jgi:hypothetical protein